MKPDQVTDAMRHDHRVAMDFVALVREALCDPMKEAEADEVRSSLTDRQRNLADGLLLALLMKGAMKAPASGSSPG